MHFTPTPLADVFEISTQWHEDERGAFGRTFCAREFAAHGLATGFVQCSFSRNRRRATLRGLHLQADPQHEAKLIYCTTGRIFDVAVDLRPGSSTFGRFHAVELVGGEGRMLYIPEGCAHGFQTLQDNSDVIYHISAFYEPGATRGVRWDDPALGIAWPLPDAAIISARDRALPSLADYDAAQ
ncbi:MAG: dTDP-4-dehydrorhamnose 3,5-epimerase [Methylobacteriaceae bacterium]|nr:dTDP-4-dehydrorhamnose 3,5-epimerase [Methylobacteriaceae bacterium]MBV9701901.1 dTDP-4-dehydrorhamnose 3,5-epimerase [Methylobacteriaceae bacterium]